MFLRLVCPASVRVSETGACPIFHLSSSLPFGFILFAVCVCVCVCVCEWEELRSECVWFLIAVGYLLTYDTPPACLGRWLLLSSCENQAYTNTGKTETRWTKCSIPLIDSVSACVCVCACLCVCVCVMWWGLILWCLSCAAYPVEIIK